MNLESNDLEVIIKILGLVVLAITAWKGIKELRRAQKWKQAEFLANEFKNFNDNEYVKKAFLILEGHEIKIKYLDSEDKHGYFKSDSVQLKSSLRNNHPESSHGRREYNKDILLNTIRIFIDTFLWKLGGFQIYLDHKLINKKLLQPYIIYWLELLIIPNDDMLDREAKTIIYKYIIDNKIYSLIQLFRTYGYEIPGAEKIAVNKS